MVQRVDYKGYVLSSDTRMETDKTWRPAVLIVHYNGQEARERVVVSDTPMEDMDLADEMSIELGKHWIDDRPDPFA